MTYANLADSADLAGYGADYQLLPDAASEAAGDALYCGGSVPFCELAFDLTGGTGQVATWAADGGLWEYWNGAAWATLTVAQDNTDTTAADGLRPFQQSGAMHFVPPSAWAASTIDSQEAYWIRWRVTDAQLTQEPITDSSEHELVTPTDGIQAAHAGTVIDLRASDQASTLHTATDVKFILMNFTTGAHSGELTWAQDLRSDAWSGLTLAVAAGDELGIVVTQEDGTNEISNALLEMIVTPS